MMCDHEFKMVPYFSSEAIAIFISFSSVLKREWTSCHLSVSILTESLSTMTSIEILYEYILLLHFLSNNEILMLKYSSNINRFLYSLFLFFFDCSEIRKYENYSMNYEFSMNYANYCTELMLWLLIRFI